MEPSISIPKPRLCAPLWLSGAEVGMEMKDAKEVETMEDLNQQLLEEQDHRS